MYCSAGLINWKKNTVRIWYFMLSFDIAIHRLAHPWKSPCGGFKIFYFGVFITVVFFFEISTVHILNRTFNHFRVEAFIMVGWNERWCGTGSHSAIESLVKNDTRCHIAPWSSRNVLIRASGFIGWF